jgi:Ribonuclease I
MQAKLLALLCVMSLVSVINSVPYDYYVFASIWAGTNCYMQPCYENQTASLNPTFVNIHGLWPNYFNGYPQYCDNTSSYNPNNIPSLLLNKMETNWNGMNWTTYDFHDHEWTKHGTCWNDPAGDQVSDSRKQLDYFTTVMSIALRQDIYGALKRGGVVPRSEPYDLDSFTNAMNRAFGNGTYLLECETDDSNNQYIFSFYICLDLKYQLMTCPDNLGDHFNDLCPPGLIYYPPVGTSNQTYVFDV